MNSKTSSLYDRIYLLHNKYAVMKQLLCFFVLFAVIFVLTVPLANADVSTVQAVPGSSQQGCEETNSCYSPNPVTVNVGDTVIWNNVDSVAHTVTSGNPSDGPDGIFDSSLFEPGKSFSHTFNSPGTYDYFCMVHPWTAGNVVVKSTGTTIEKPPVVSTPSVTGSTTVQAAPGSSQLGCEKTNTCYTPYSISVNVGDTVTWNNADTTPHTVTSGNPSDGPDGIFDSGLFPAGESFWHTFNSPGTYDYFCLVHPWMEGEVVVRSTGVSIPSKSEPEPFCGAGTILENGVCVAVDRGGGCLIATAAYGSELAPQVQQLREIRDNTLLKTSSGTSFMDGFNSFYYSFSPTIADWERQNPAFKQVVKTTITPMIATLSILKHVDIDSEAEMLSYGIGIILMNIGMYFVVHFACNCYFKLFVLI